MLSVSEQRSFVLFSERLRPDVKVAAGAKKILRSTQITIPWLVAPAVHWSASKFIDQVL